MAAREDTHLMTVRNSRLDLPMAVLLALPFSVVFVGRVLPGLVAEPLRADLGLSDTQLGFLTGLLYGIVYLVAAIPLARIADRFDRSLLIGGLLVLFAVTTACGGFAAGFWTLMLSRVLIGACESGVFSPSIALLADKLPAGKRPWGLSVYMAGQVFAYSGLVLAVGFVTSRFGWRGACFAISAMAVAVAALVLGLVGDKKRPAPSTNPATFLSVLRMLRAKRSFIHLVVATALYLLVDSAAGTWIPAFLTRSFGKDLGSTSRFMALGTGIFNGAVVFAAGPLLSRVRRIGARGPLLAVLCATVLSTTGYVVGFSAASSALALPSLLLAMSMSSLIAAPLFSCIQELARAEYRSTAIALAVTPAMFFGAGGGPQLTGIASDLLAPHYGAQSLRWALTGMSGLFGSWVILHYWWALRTIDTDTEHEELEAQAL